MVPSNESLTVTDVQRALGQRLATVPTVIEVDAVGQASRRSITPRIMHQGVETPVTASGLY